MRIFLEEGGEGHLFIGKRNWWESDPSCESHRKILSLRKAVGKSLRKVVLWGSHEA